MFLKVDKKETIKSSPNLLFKPKGSENPDSSEPSALTVVR